MKYEQKLIIIFWLSIIMITLSGILFTLSIKAYDYGNSIMGILGIGIFAYTGFQANDKLKDVGI